MTLVTDSALKERARALMVAMTDRSRWVYALPEGSFAQAVAVAGEKGLTRRAEEGDVVKYEGERGERLVLFDHKTLGVVMLEGAGDAVADVVRAIVESTGFVPQSKLWGAALDIGTGESQRALSILAHMCVSWDDDWTDVFLLQLASPDATVRRHAIDALTLAAMVAGDVDPALALLKEARDRERFPQLAKVYDEAAGVLRAFDGEPLEVGGG